MEKINNWGYNIRRLREERGMTQAELAKKSGLGHGHISKIEHGYYKNPSQPTFEKLAYGLSLVPSDLSQEIYGKRPSIPKETAEPILERLKLALPIAVPIYGRYPFRPGEGIGVVGHEYLPREVGLPKNLEGYEVRDDCLMPTLESHDTIIIERGGNIDEGDIVASLINGELCIAKLRRIAGELWLENNFGRHRFEDCLEPSPVIQCVRNLRHQT